jgi:hypothetical protein
METGARLIDENDQFWMAAFERITVWAWLEEENR